MRPPEVYARGMGQGHHAADPAGRSRYAAAVLVSVAVVVLLAVGAFALTAFSQH